VQGRKPSLLVISPEPNFDLMHSISYFSQFLLDEFIANGGENVHKVGRTLLLTGWLSEET
jgi:hypothetical protein